jgi:hypothetical protein
MNGNMRTHDNRYCSRENPHLAHRILFHDAKVGVRYTLNARTIWGLVFYAVVINSDGHARQMLHADQ